MEIILGVEGVEDAVIDAGASTVVALVLSVNKTSSASVLVQDSPGG